MPLRTELQGVVIETSYQNVTALQLFPAIHPFQIKSPLVFRNTAFKCRLYHLFSSFTRLKSSFVYQFDVELEK